MKRSDYPIALAHGFARFDEPARRWVSGWDARADRFHYFRGIRRALTEAGFTVFHTNVPWGRDVRTRAAELRRQVLQITDTHGKVHIIAHSMGGLDARHMLYHDGRPDGDRIATRVASLSTIGTPHWGSCLATIGTNVLASFPAPLAKMASSLAGMHALTPEACAAFNERAADFERDNEVFYQTFAGVQRDPARVSLILRPSHEYVQRREGDNDGLVSLASAKWRDALFVGPPLEADHLNEVGWSDAFVSRQGTSRALERRIQAFYVRIAEGLRVPRDKTW